MFSTTERIFEHRGYMCFVVLRKIGSWMYRCGYVAVDIQDSFDSDLLICHGGITFDNQEAPTPLVQQNNTRYLGIDCAHCGDILEFWTTEKVCDELRKIVEQIIEMKTEE